MRKLLSILLLVLIMPISGNWIAENVTRHSRRSTFDFGSLRAQRRFDINNQERLINDLTARLGGNDPSTRKAVGQHAGLLVDDRGSASRQEPPPPKDPGSLTRVSTNTDVSGKGGGTKDAGGFDTSSKGGDSFDTSGKGGGDTIIVGGAPAQSTQTSAKPQIRIE